MRARFDRFELDLNTRELWKHGVRIPLQDQPARILCLLVAAAGAVITREQIKRDLWPPGIHLDFEHSINKAIGKLRAALKDDRRQPHFIETLSQRGYRFIAPLESGPALRHRLLVLPLHADRRDHRHLAERVSERIIAILAAMEASAFAVIAYSTAVRYRGTRKHLLHIAAELRASHVLMGHLSDSEARISLRAEFVRADGTSIWLRRFEIVHPNAHHSADDLAQQVAVALASSLSGTAAGTYRGRDLPAVA